MQLIGKYKRTIYQTVQGGTCIASYELQEQEEENAVVTGLMLPTLKNVTYIFEGTWVNHPKYGKQFKAESYTESVEGNENIIQYLSSGLIKGIGRKTAEKIVKKYGEHTLEYLDADIECLLSVKGISKKSIEKIKASYGLARAAQEVVLTLSKSGISPKLAMKAYDTFKEETPYIINNQPYKLCFVNGITFLTADAIGKKKNIPGYETDYERFKVCAKYVLYGNESNEFKNIIGNRTAGSIAMDKDDFGKVMLTLLYINSIDGKFICDNTIQMLKEGELSKGVIESGKLHLMNPGMYRVEMTTAEHIKRIFSYEDNVTADIDVLIQEAELLQGFSLGEEQRNAVKCSFINPVSLIIGPPGSGKTTILKTIIDVNEKAYHHDVIFLAPSGKAASRIKETTNHSATTVHSGLQIGTEIINDVGPEETKFDNCIVIVDELSMLDARTAYRLFSSIGTGCRVILCGDDEQLQSVGAGAVLRDLIDSGVIPTTILNTVYRQAKGGEIYENCYKMRKGDYNLNYGEQFRFTEISDTMELEDEMIKLYLKKIKEYGIENVMLTVPFKQHNAGVNQLNERIQNILCPAREGEIEFKYGNLLFRNGDVIMQLKNDMENEVMNGDMGAVTNITKIDDEVTMTATFNNCQKIYTKDNADEITLAYAYTIHKAQGSEAKCVITCVHAMHSIMLKRNVFYTAVTRAREEVNILGQKDALKKAISTEDKSKRNTLLKHFLFMLFKGFVPLSR